MKKILYLLLLTLPALAQQRLVFRADTLAKVTVAGQALSNAWAGGFNAPQFSRLRLDADTTADLVVFDRAGNKLSTFLALKQGSGYVWRHAPQYESQFPADLSDWMLLVDFDGDGRRDLFTRATLGLRAFRNAGTEGGPLRWESVADPIRAEGFSGNSNLYIPPTDIPALTDLDGDGDLDIAAFEREGDFVEYYRNESMETTGKRGLLFRKIDVCWGNFWKEHCKDFRFDIDCKTGAFGNGRLIGEVELPRSGPADPLRGNPARGEGILHAGNSLLVTDLTGDGRKDALFGHITCQNVAFLPNTGTPQVALFQSVTYEFPSTQPVLFNGFPALFQEDLDFDGKPDLVAAPNSTVNEGDLVDYRRSAWFYQNISTGPVANFALRQTDFLQNTTLDLGENAAPLLVDLDGDGDLDLLVGYGGVRGETGYRGGLAQYRNVGTPGKPVFEWQTDDYLGLAQQFLMTDVRPFLADLNADGVPDLGFAANSFKGLELRFLPNRGNRGGAFSHSAATALQLGTPANLTAADTPLFTDVDGDGKTDLLVGKYYQNLEFYRNTGSSNPIFTLVTETFGGSKEDFSQRGQTPLVADVDGDGKADLLTLNESGMGRLYRTLTNGLSTALVADTL
ncbi:MAG: VCBS repeat-containing protein, partial [Sphingobacteriaceae bacterium]|nr:VCBS repeat-containing protein [Cytophagaceae bacterium]